MITGAYREEHQEYNGCAGVLRSLHPSDEFYLVTLIHSLCEIWVRPAWPSLYTDHHCLLDWSRLKDEKGLNKEALKDSKNKVLMQALFTAKANDKSAGSCTQEFESKPISRKLDKSRTFKYGDLKKLVESAGLTFCPLRPADAGDDTTLLALVWPGENTKVLACRPDDLMELPPKEFTTKRDEEGQSPVKQVWYQVLHVPPVTSDTVRKFNEHLISNY